MKFLIGKFFSFLLLLTFNAYSSNSQKCHIIKPIVSLSGPISYLLKEFKLIGDPNLKAVSSYHHFIKDFKGKRVSGGIYLSLKSLKNSFKENFVLFSDESQEIEKRLTFIKKNVEFLEEIHFVETKGKDPFAVAIESANQLMPYLAASCKYRYVNLKKEINETFKLIKKAKFSDSKTFLFYLGDRRTGGRYQTILARDGFNLVFLQNKNFKTYPSNLPYLTPSQKILSRIKGEILHVGLSESNEEGFTVEKISKGNFNVYGQGVLYPGLSQIHFMQAFVSWLDKGSI
jgi:hypothetical protein